MKIITYLIILFFFLSSPVQSNEWKLVYENSLNEDRVFIDISNIEKKDNLIYFWDMLSHKEFNDTHKYWPLHHTSKQIVRNFCIENLSY